ncbi:MAG TPA: cytochrome c3 family protein [Bdellovibrionota bacterium]|nr:cytochrome c3 family protein [Bdellovibrionota bacterium]
MTRPTYILFFLAVLMSGCGHDSPGENYGDIINSPQSLILTEEEHQPGWQRSDCFGCHLPKNIHQSNQSSLAGIDLDAIQEIVRTQGEAACAGCHGTNGL